MFIERINAITLSLKPSAAFNPSGPGYRFSRTPRSQSRGLPPARQAIYSHNWGNNCKVTGVYPQHENLHTRTDVVLLPCILQDLLPYAVVDKFIVEHVRISLFTCAIVIRSGIVKQSLLCVKQFPLEYGRLSLTDLCMEPAEGSLPFTARSNPEMTKRQGTAVFRKQKGRLQSFANFPGDIFPTVMNR